jgi:hypothetical protein
MYDVTLGRDVETDQFIKIGDMERRSGLYILGRPGSGKTTLIKKIIAQDIENDHGVFFLDPHGDAIDDLLQRIPPKRRDDVYVIDPTDETHTFGMNLLACSDISRLDEREKTFDRAKGIFTKLFANPQTGTLDVLLDKYLRNSFYPLIANQGYTIAEIPLVLTDSQFRNHLLRHPAMERHYKRVVEFWRDEFDQLPRRDQQEQIESTLTRLGSFTRPYIQHIVGQSQTRLDFTDIMDTGKILFVKLSSNLSVDHKRIIGTILVSHLVSAVFQRDKRPEAQRRHFCIFIDEFQNFAGSEDFAILFTQGRKFAVATTIAHQERFGQFADNKVILGATDAAGNKIFFQPAVKDADEQAPEFAKASPTETRRERKLVISQEPVADLLRGHAHPDIRRYVNEYLRYLHDQLEDTKEAKEAERLYRQDWLDEAAYARASVEVDDRRGAIVQSSAVVAATRAAIRGAQGQTAQLLQLYERSQRLRVTLRFFNRFLTALMEGHISPGQENFSAFLIDRVRDFSTLSTTLAPVLELYISLSYGDPNIVRSIPFAFAKDQKLFTDIVTPIQREAEEKVGREQEAFLQGEQEAFNTKWRKVEASWQTEKQQRHESAWERVSTSALDFRRAASQHPPYFDKNFRLPGDEFVEAYIPLFLYPSVAEALKPYYTARFARPWADTFPNSTQTLSWLLSWERFFRHRSVSALEYFNYWNPPLGSWGRLVQKFRSGPAAGTCLEGRFYEIDVLDGFAQFLKQYGEGAIVTLILLMTLREPRKWRRSDKLHSRWVVYLSGQYNMLYMPTLVNREPLDLLFLFVKLTDLLGQTNNDKSRPCAWWCPQYFTGYPIGASRAGFATGTSYNWSFFTYELKRLEERNDMQKLRQLVPENRVHWWQTTAKLTRTYLMSRACDIALYGQKVADRTFPQPTLQGVPPSQVAEMVTFMAQLFEEEERQRLKQREQQSRTEHETHVQQEFSRRFGLKSLPVPAYLPTRVLRATDRAMVIKACQSELRRTREGAGVLKVVDDFVGFCELLHRPENHIWVQSTQYIEKEVNTYTTAEMRNQMAQELINLQPHYAYMKSTWKGKIQTLDVSVEPGALLSAGRGDLVDVRMTARRNALSVGILRTRGDIEEEIRERQDNWRRRPGNEPPPPTSTGGNSPPSLPSASAGSDREPPQTHSIPERAPAQKPPGNSDVSQQGTGAYRPPETEEKSILAPLRPSPANAPSRPQPLLEFESLRFFESEGAIPQKEQRRYSTGFPQRTACYINLELAMRNRLYRQRSEIYAFKPRYYKPDGSLMWEGPEDTFIKFDNERQSYATGSGWAQPGSWNSHSAPCSALLPPFSKSSR